MVSVEDAAVRVLIDELDRLGITVSATCTLWEALARVWDPGSPGAGGAEGGLIVADNTLWSGKVLDPQAASDHAIVAYNKKIFEDPRVEQVLLSVRDGVMLARKIA